MLKCSVILLSKMISHNYCKWLCAWRALKLTENFHSTFCNYENLSFLFCASICFALLPHWFNEQLSCFLYSALLLRTTFPICKNSLPLTMLFCDKFSYFYPSLCFNWQLSHSFKDFSSVYLVQERDATGMFESELQALHQFLMK